MLKFENALLTFYLYVVTLLKQISLFFLAMQ